MSDVGKVAGFYVEALTEHVASQGRVPAYRVEALTEHVQSAGRVTGFYVEVLSEGPWAPNDPRGRVAGFYVEVLSEPPPPSQFPTQYPGLRYALNSIIYDLCLVAVADAPSGMGGVLKVQKNGTAYAVYLVETTDPNASHVRVKTSAGVKSLRLLT